MNYERLSFSWLLLVFRVWLVEGGGAEKMFIYPYSSVRKSISFFQFKHFVGFVIFSRSSSSEHYVEWLNSVCIEFFI